MNHKSLPFALAACFLSSCAMMPPPGPMTRCGAVCSVEVQARMIDARRCEITMPAMDHKVHVGQGSRSEIVWSLTRSPGFQFANPGIVFRAPPPNTFSGSPGASPQEFVVRVNNTQPGSRGEHKYHIVVQNGGVTCRLDPWVVNE